MKRKKGLIVPVILLLLAAGIIYHYRLTDKMILLKDRLAERIAENKKPRGKTPPKVVAPPALSKEAKSRNMVNTQIHLEKLHTPQVQVRLLKKMSFQQCLNLIGSPTDSMSHLLPQHMVWVAQLYYPQGYQKQTPGQGELVTEVYDLETAAFWGRKVQPEVHKE